MSKLNEKAVALLNENKVQLIIGYEKGTKKTRPFFCSSAEEANKLIFDAECKNNLAVYLTRKDLVGDNKVAIIATCNILKSILQLDKENQINKENLVVLTVDNSGEVFEFNDYDEIKKYIEEHPIDPDQKMLALLEKIDNMSREERWTYWKQELSKCIRCYACRAACPLCYCNRCITEVNCPQWIDPWTSTLSNMEWQINRVMHMSGRCTGCGACADACPLELPIGVLTKKMALDIQNEFGQSDAGNVLSTFNPNDKENFIH